MYHILFIHLYIIHLCIICWWSFHLFLSAFGYHECTALNLDVQISVHVPLFSSSGYIPRSRIVGLHDKSIFNFWRNHHAVDRSGRTVLHTQQRCPKLPTPALLIDSTVAYRTRIWGLLLNEERGERGFKMCQNKATGAACKEVFHPGRIHLFIQ